VQTREDLAAKVWGQDFSSFQSRTIDVHVRRIRHKLGPGLSGRLLTVSGAGYRFQ
jgi:DNA-binding response OmpR family regulator